ncbi:transposase IS4 family protein [Corchorus olitorius]|uniref:Transposase IS4 family protein n=1 Tax=Corchorus olitorius TaxID=93759 RepID=A0A1R3JNV9_9ROSI|nr:transposase IS4 family protein [Corchorus olitorius]
MVKESLLISSKRLGSGVESPAPLLVERPGGPETFAASFGDREEHNWQRHSVQNKERDWLHHFDLFLAGGTPYERVLLPHFDAQVEEEPLT